MVSTLKVAASYGRHTGRRRCPARLRGDRPGLGSVRLQRQQDKMLMLHRPSAISNSVERPEGVLTNQRSDRVRFTQRVRDHVRMQQAHVTLYSKWTPNLQVHHSSNLKKQLESGNLMCL
jgi:hypothetical protein